MCREFYKSGEFDETKNEYAFNPTWNEGGFFHYGNDKGFGLSNGSHYNTITLSIWQVGD
jgi:hypothetical protein